MKLILGTLPVAILVAYSQLIVKWRLTNIGYKNEFPTLWEKLVSYFGLLLDPFILSSFAAALMGSFAWILVVSRFPLAWAFPIYQGITFALVLAFSWILLGEQLTPMKLLAILLILSGVILGVLD